jgi:ArsR family metal-binding transcriptional regulator
MVRLLSWPLLKRGVHLRLLVVIYFLISKLRISLLLKEYKIEFCRPPNPTAQHLRCFVYFDENISDLLPYLNTDLKGYQYIKDPPSLTLKYNGKLITLYSREIHINIIQDEDEAKKIIGWLREKINEVRKRREEIRPSFETQQRPGILHILKMLPKTNCRECGEPTCMVFAVSITEGRKSPENCTQLDIRHRTILKEYLEQFCVT